jgi:hypothetical protein
MHDRRRHLTVTGGRLALLVLATGTGWAAVTSSAGGHAVGAVLVGAPAFAATTPRPAATSSAAAATSSTAATASRARLSPSALSSRRRSAGSTWHALVSVAPRVTAGGRTASRIVVSEGVSRDLVRTPAHSRRDAVPR